jgi:MinD superfamily P-loop ATPase
MAVINETDRNALTVDLETFYGSGGTFDELKQRYNVIQADFRFFSTVAGALIGLVIGLTLIELSVKRTRKQYEIDLASCVNCGRCFNYCPQNSQKYTNSLNNPNNAG